MAEQQKTTPAAAPASKPDATKPAAGTDTTETKLRAENAALRAQLAAAGLSPRVQSPAHTFQLSEGARQEMISTGYATIDGVRYTRAQVEDKLTDSQIDVDLGDVEPRPEPEGTVERSAIRGVDFVYPSVKPGFIDPAVAGTPGVNGPAAE